MTKRLASLLAFLAVLFGASVAVPASADAAAYTNWVNAPTQWGAWTVGAAANVNGSCDGTYGCWNYMKIERWNGSSWTFVAGRWIGGGTQYVSGYTSGCGTYRTAIDSYNDILTSYNYSAQFGVKIAELGGGYGGQTIKRFNRTWTSGNRYLCFGY